MLDRIAHGLSRVVMSPVRMALLPFTFAANMLKTGLDTVKALAKGDVGEALKSAVGGTAMAAGKAGVTALGNFNPITTFAAGAAMKTGDKLD